MEISHINVNRQNYGVLTKKEPASKIDNLNTKSIDKDSVSLTNESKNIITNKEVFNKTLTSNSKNISEVHPVEINSLTNSKVRATIIKSNGRKIFLDEEGRFRDEKGNLIGSVSEYGRIEDANHTSLGRINEAGQIFTKNGSLLGSITYNSYSGRVNVLDNDNRRILGIEVGHKGKYVIESDYSSMILNLHDIGEGLDLNKEDIKRIVAFSLFF